MKTHRGRIGAAVLALAIVGLAAWAGFQMSLSGAVEATMQQAARRLDLFDRTLEAMIERFHYLPSTITQADEPSLVLERPGDPTAQTAANRFLSKLNQTAGADELFIMDAEGSVVASTNWWSLTSLVGQNFSFRPYFANAMFNGTATYYAFGIATSVPGYFLSQRIDGPDGPLGVAVVKISLGELEAIWWRSGELIGILDVNDVFILSTRPDWRYRPLLTLMPAMAEVVTTQQRYGENGIRNEGVIAGLRPWRTHELAHFDSTDAELAGDFLVQELRLSTHGWRLASFVSVTSLSRGAWTAAAASGLGCAAALLIAALLVQRQRTVAARLAGHELLEANVALRTAELKAANEQLKAEIAERQRAEKERHDAQLGLVQAAKLASLGQALAGVAHEVSQPVAALATQIASAKLLVSKGGGAEVGAILKTMDGVLARLSALTGHLRNFARKESPVAVPTNLAGVVDNALELAGHRLKAFAISVDFASPPGALLVLGNPIHLEQVVLNLISNAADAMEHAAVRRLTSRLGATGNEAVLTVADTGAGIDSAALEQIFDPFFTTKTAGRGLGLGLSISCGLVGEMGGAISVESTPGEGTVFAVTLPLTTGQAGKTRGTRT